jgi:hypothetical protein
MVATAKAVSKASGVSAGSSRIGISRGSKGAVAHAAPFFGQSPRTVVKINLHDFPHRRGKSST